MIDYLTHYYRKGSEPFQSLSALADTEALNRMKAMYIKGSIFWERFEDPGWYLNTRREVEAWLRSEFISRGGNPRETYPIYMILGSSKWAESVGDSETLSTTAEIRVPLSLFKEEDLSFTYPDSMVTWYLEHEKNVEYYQPGYHGKLFTLSEIQAIIELKGMPGEGWETRVPRRLAHYIEAQVWNRELLLEYWRRLKSENSTT